MELNELDFVIQMDMELSKTSFPYFFQNVFHIELTNDKNLPLPNNIDGGEIEISEIDELTELKELMDEYSDDDHDNNPRNILFTDKEIDSTSGKVVDEEEIYGPLLWRLSG